MCAEIFSFPFLCCTQLTQIPIWEYWGYWNPQVSPPDWVFDPANIALIAECVRRIKPAKLRLRLKFEKTAPASCGGVCGSYTFSDDANPWIEPDKTPFAGFPTAHKARRFVLERWHATRRLYVGDVEALLVQQQTGVPCLPPWITDNHSLRVGFKEGVKRIIPRSFEVSSSGLVSFAKSKS